MVTLQQTLFPVYRAICLIWLLLVLVTFWGVACAQEQPAADDSEAYRILESEKALAEDIAGLLKEFKERDLQAYAEGLQLYAFARGDFNGLIEQIKHNLIAEEEFEQSETFRFKLQSAVNKRMAFTRHVHEKVIKPLGDDGTKGIPVLAALLADPAKLISAITEAAKTIWQEYRKIQDTRRKEMLDQLDEMKWVNFQKAGV